MRTPDEAIANNTANWTPESFAGEFDPKPPITEPNPNPEEPEEEEEEEEEYEPEDEEDE